MNVQPNYCNLFPAELLSPVPHGTTLFYQCSRAKDRASGDGLGKDENDSISSRLSSGNLSQLSHATAKSGHLIWQ
jgi:hypothetical protein